MDVKTLYDATATSNLQRRIAALGPQNARRWGTMTAAQAMAHCALGMEFALGEKIPPRMLLGRIIGGLIKPLALGAMPMRRNVPTASVLIVTDERELETEKQRLAALVERFASGGPPACTRHAHTFFGKMTPDEWAILMYKHTDHHLRQFGA